MALILIRGDSDSKVINSIKNIQKQGHLNLTSKPKVIDHFYADALVESILKSKIKTKSCVAVAFFVKEDTSFSILQVKNAHPPAHVTVVSSYYDAYSKVEYLLNDSDIVYDYGSVKMHSKGMIDYSMDKKERSLIKNDRLNSYIK